MIYRSKEQLPTISMPQASASQDGYLDSADFATFATKQDALTGTADVPGLDTALDAKQDTTSLLTAFLEAAGTAGAGQAVVSDGAGGWDVVDMPGGESLQYIETITGVSTTNTTIQTAATTAAVAESGAYLVDLVGSLQAPLSSGQNVTLGYRINSGTDVISVAPTSVHGGTADYASVGRVEGFRSQVSLTAGDTVSLRCAGAQNATQQISLTLWRISS
jgi:hypothetical protein